MYRRLAPRLRAVRTGAAPALAALAAFAFPTAEAIGEAPAPAHPEDLTGTEVRDSIAAGRTTILVSIGGTEQNGPHVAPGKHHARLRVLAERIAGRIVDRSVEAIRAAVRR